MDPIVNWILALIEGLQIERRQVTERRAPRCKLVKVHFERSALKLVAIEHLHGIDSIFRCCKHDAPKASASSVRTETDVGTLNLTSGSEEILQILPLTVERYVANK